MTIALGSLTVGANGQALAVSTASTVSAIKLQGPVILTPVGTNCYVRQGSSVAQASSASTACDQFLVQNGAYKFMAFGYIAAQASSGTGVLYINPTDA